MSIKNEQFLKDLQPYARMTVLPGITVGDLNFSSAQSIFSTGYLQPAAGIGGVNVGFTANTEVDLFQSAIGDGGQGLAPGQVMTRSQTNWLDSQGRLPANEVFIGIRCMVSVFLHQNADPTANNGASFAGAAGAYSQQMPLPSVTALWDILKSFSWEYQTGDGIIRNVGPLAGFPQAGGVWEAPATTVPLVPAYAFAIAAQNGWPCTAVAKDLPIPFMFLPNITTRIKAKCGSPMILFPGETALAGFFPAVRMTFQGYKLTMPV